MQASVSPSMPAVASSSINTEAVRVTLGPSPVAGAHQRSNYRLPQSRWSPEVRPYPTSYWSSTFHLQLQSRAPSLACPTQLLEYTLNSTLSRTSNRSVSGCSRGSGNSGDCRGRHRVLRDDNKTTGSARPHVSQGERGKIHTVKKDAPACERFHEAKSAAASWISWAKGTRRKGD